MHLRKVGRHVVVHTPAKLNLFFEVLDRRSDGFHEVETLVYPIDLWDTLIVGPQPNSEDITFRVRLDIRSTRVASPNSIPMDASNLVVRAVELLRENVGVDQGAEILLIKRIPSEAGLGGGSSDAAAALVAANLVWKTSWPEQQLSQIGAALGSDIPLFFRRGASICRGRGEIVESVSPWPMLHFALVRPPVGLSTAEVYGACRPAKPQRSLNEFVDTFTSADPGRIGNRLFNRLETAASELTPWVARARRAFEAHDCMGHQMTGSGTCYFGLCRHRRHALRVARHLESLGIGRAYVARGCG